MFSKTSLMMQLSFLDRPLSSPPVFTNIKSDSVLMKASQRSVLTLPFLIHYICTQLLILLLLLILPLYLLILSLSVCTMASNSRSYSVNLTHRI